MTTPIALTIAWLALVVLVSVLLARIGRHHR